MTSLGKQPKFQSLRILDFNKATGTRTPSGPDCTIFPSVQGPHPSARAPAADGAGRRRRRQHHAPELWEPPGYGGLARKALQITKGL